MSEPSTVFPQETHWEADGSHRIPFVADTGDELYKRERERFFFLRATGAESGWRPRYRTRVTTSARLAASARSS